MIERAIAALTVSESEFELTWLRVSCLRMFVSEEVRYQINYNTQQHLSTSYFHERDASLQKYIIAQEQVSRNRCKSPEHCSDINTSFQIQTTPQDTVRSQILGLVLMNSESKLLRSRNGENKPYMSQRLSLYDIFDFHPQRLQSLHVRYMMLFILFIALRRYMN